MDSFLNNLLKVRKILANTEYISGTIQLKKEKTLTDPKSVKGTLRFIPCLTG